MDNSYEIFEAKISVRSKLQYLQKMKCKLQPFPNRYMMFSDSVFGPWLDLHEFSNDNHLLNYVLQHQEFCLATRFRCGELSELVSEKLWCSLDDEDAVRDSIPNLVLLPTSGEQKADWLVRSQYYFNGEDAPLIQSVFSTWMAFRGNTRDLGSFREEADEITDLHQILEEVLLTERGDGVAGIKRRRRDLSSDGVRRFSDDVRT
ncbi:hypothetical protein Tco_0506593 [Tanacetum coccineum]